MAIKGKFWQLLVNLPFCKWNYIRNYEKYLTSFPGGKKNFQPCIKVLNHCNFKDFIHHYKYAGLLIYSSIKFIMFTGVVIEPFIMTLILQAHQYKMKIKPLITFVFYPHQAYQIPLFHSPKLVQVMIVCETHNSSIICTFLKALKTFPGLLTACNESLAILHVCQSD